MSYTEDFAENNTDNEQDKQSVIDAIDNIFVPKTEQEWLDSALTNSVDISTEGISQAIWNSPDFSTDLGAALKSTAKFVNGATAAYTLYAGVEAIKAQNPVNPNFEVAKLYTSTAASVVAAAGTAALAVDGLAIAGATGFFATSLLPPVAMAVAGYAAYKLVDHYYDDIIEAYAQEILDTAQGVADFVSDAMEGTEDVIESIVDDPNFFEDFGDYVSDVVEPLDGLIDDVLGGLLPPELTDALSPLDDAEGVNPPGAGGGGDPLVLDMNGDGQISLTSVENGVYFDIWGDGFARRTGWVAPEDGMLALDQNGNGTIDDLSELFGSGHFAVANDNSEYQAKPIRRMV